MNKILVPVDFSEVSRYAAEFAVDLAERSDAEMIFLYSMQFKDFNDFPHDRDKDLPSMIDDVNKFISTKMKKFVDELKTKATIKTRISSSQLLDAVKTTISEESVDLVVVGTKGASGISGVLVGSNTEKIVRWAECPVISVPVKTSFEAIKKILVPIDLAKVQETFMLGLTNLQKLFSAQLEFLWINPKQDIGKNDLVTKDFNELLEKYEFKNSSLIIANDSSVSDGILELASSLDADMISMATHSRKGLSLLLSGSLTGSTINEIKIPVWSFKLDENEENLKLASLKSTSVAEKQVTRKFKKGDIIVLKSGGPKMTVNGYAWQGNYESYDTIVCQWFEGDSKKIGKFSQDSVEIWTS